MARSRPVDPLDFPSSSTLGFGLQYGTSTGTVMYVHTWYFGLVRHKLLGVGSLSLSIYSSYVERAE